MELDKKRKKQIILLQQNLGSIRKIAGWTTEQLGEKIGVTKQTISNLENNKTPMSLTQYIAFRSVFELEIESNKENTILPQIINILIDNAEELNENNYNQVKNSVEIVSAAASGTKNSINLDLLFKSLLSPECVTLLATLIVQSGAISKASIWLKKIMK